MTKKLCKVTERNFSLFKCLNSGLGISNLAGDAFAGQYTLAGRLAAYNDYRGSSSVSEVGTYLKEQRGRVMRVPVGVSTERRTQFSQLVANPLVAEPVLFSGYNQGAWFDLETGKQSDPFIAEDFGAEREYIGKTLESKLLTYDKQFYIVPELRTNLVRTLRSAAGLMHESLRRSQAISAETVAKWHLYLDVGQDGIYEIDTRTPDARLIMRGEETEPFLRVRLDYSLLIMLLTGHANWTTAEIGSHLSYFRTPDVHENELHTCLSFLHF